MKSSFYMLCLGTVLATTCSLEALESAIPLADQKSNLAQSGTPASKAPVETNGVSSTVCPAAGPAFSIEYLYWKVEEDVSAGGLIKFQKNSQGNQTFNPNIKRQDFDFTSGFRAGLGYDVPYQNYDVLLTWTWLRPESSMHLKAKQLSSGVAFPIAFELVDMTGFDVAGVLESLHSKWCMEFDMLDLQLGRKFVVGKRFQLRPNVGLKGGWIEQSQHLTYQDVFVKVNGVNQPNAHGHAKKKNDFKGIGPLVGLDMRYGIGSQFGLFGSVTGALLYGHFDLKTNVFLSENKNGDPFTGIINNSHNRLSPTVQMLLGGDWARCLYNKWWIRFGAAYEVQFWWDQWRVETSIEQSGFVPYPTGDLTMHGLTLQARFDF